MIAALSAASTAAQAAGNSLKERLIGHWQLVSVVANQGTPYGAHPQGSMFLDKDGYFSVIVISEDAARSVSYFGTYSIDDADGSLTMQIDGNSGGNGVDASGREIRRRLQLNGDLLVIRNEEPDAPGNIALTWKQDN